MCGLVIGDNASGFWTAEKQLQHEEYCASQYVPLPYVQGQTLIVEWTEPKPPPKIDWLAINRECS